MTGSRVRVSGEGEQVRRRRQVGDLYFRVRLAPHRALRAEGARLCTSKVAVPVTTAVLGGEVDVQTLVGQAGAAANPADDAEGAGVPAQGHGMPVVGKPDGQGDLYARVDVQLPTRLRGAANAEHYGR